MSLVSFARSVVIMREYVTVNNWKPQIRFERPRPRRRYLPHASLIVIWISIASVPLTACGSDLSLVTEGDFDRPDHASKQRQDDAGGEGVDDQAQGTVEGREHILGACREENERWEMFDVQHMFGESRQWFRVPGSVTLDITPSDYRRQDFSPAAVEVRIDPAWAIDESETEAIVVPAWIVDRIEDAYEVRPEMYVSTSSPTDDPGVMTHGAVFVVDDEDIALVASCGYEGFSQALQRTRPNSTPRHETCWRR